MQQLRLILLLLIPVFSFAQVKNIGIPSIINYNKSVYNAGTQNWDISQDKNGFMYFANNDGVLQFDGVHWNLINVSQSSPVRSVLVDDENTIFVGLYNDFGILDKDKNGKLIYKSLRNLIPEKIEDIENIWKIHQTPYGIIFQSYDYFFIYKDNKIKIRKPITRFHLSFVAGGRLFLHEPGMGLFEYINGVIDKVPWADRLTDYEIWSILEIWDNQLLICTREEGIFKFANGELKKWNTEANKLIEEYKIFSAAKVLGNHFAFGTILNGVIISDSDGNIIQHINQKNGLQNNTILSIFKDKHNNLWLGLDNGIDYIEINSPISYITDREGLGTGYCCQVFKGNLYLGTNQGLFVKAFHNSSTDNARFELINNTEGQVWSLDVFDGQLICGHNSGTFVVNKNKAVLISNEAGAWKYIQLKENPELLLGGHYNGLTLLKKENGKWSFFKKIEGFDESSRFIFQDSTSNIWISHGNKGIFRLKLNAEKGILNEIKIYDSKDGLPSDEQNILFGFNGREYFSTIAGIYSHNESTDSFVYNRQMNSLFNVNSRLKTVEVDIDKNIWFIAQNEIGVLRRNEDLTYTKITDPFRQLIDHLVKEFEFIYPLSNDNVFIGIDNGFAHYSARLPKSYSQEFKSYITKVEVPYVDIVIYNTINRDTVYKFPYKKNTFRFHYTAPFYENISQLQFSFLLENYSDQWSEWSTDTYRDFNNLKEGNYTFKIKARNIYGNESEVSSFAFTINPPWYRSQFAYYTYVIIFILTVWMLIRFIFFRIELSRKKEKIKHEEELQKKEKQFQHQALIAEKEIIRLRNEKLRNEMIHRDKELANQTMGIIQKNKFLIKLKEEIQRISKMTEDGGLKTKLTLLNRKLIKEIDNKHQSKIFETYFDEVHEDFFKELKKRFPDLSPREMRLCAFIKMNLTSKEIATLLNISDRGVEISRYRLRKKLGIPRDTNLSTFLSNI